MLGFSAGGRLASLLGTQPTLYVDAADDLAPRVSAPGAFRARVPVRFELFPHGPHGMGLALDWLRAQEAGASSVTATPR